MSIENIKSNAKLYPFFHTKIVCEASFQSAWKELRNKLHHNNYWFSLNFRTTNKCDYVNFTFTFTASHFVSKYTIKLNATPIKTFTQYFLNNFIETNYTYFQIDRIVVKVRNKLKLTHYMTCEFRGAEIQMEISFMQNNRISSFPIRFSKVYKNSRAPCPLQSMLQMK